MSVFFRQFQHLLPRARAWRITVAKPLRQLFEGLAPASNDVRTFIDDVYGDIDPYTTRQLPLWEDQFNLPDTGLTEAQRRDRLAGAWQATGGQSPKYIQDTLQAAGFDVYLHDATILLDTFALSDGSTLELSSTFALGTGLTVPNPLTLLGNGLLYYVSCGEEGAQCGEGFALCGNSITGSGYALDNRRLLADPAAVPGFSSEYWPFFLYIGAAAFPNIATIPAARQLEFEELCLKICPTHLWLGMLVEYV